MPDNPYEPDDIQYFHGSDERAGMETVHKHYEITDPMTRDELTEYLGEIEPDLEDATYYVHYEIEREDGSTFWKSSRGFGEDELDFWEYDLDWAEGEYNGVATGGVSVVIVGR